MSVMCTVVENNNVVAFELVAGRNGDPMFKISWYNGKRWKTARYSNFDDAYQTWKLLKAMIQ